MVVESTETSLTNKIEEKCSLKLIHLLEEFIVVSDNLTTARQCGSLNFTKIVFIVQIVASLLLFVEEEDTFWLMCTIVEDLVPTSYYSSTLIGVQADQRVLRQLIVSYLPPMDEQLKEHDIELSLITLHWFLTAFASVVHTKVVTCTLHNSIDIVLKT